MQYNIQQPVSPAQRYFLSGIIPYLLVGIAYFVTAKLGLLVPYKESVATLMWLPTGIAVGAIMRWGHMSTVPVLIAATLVELSLGLPIYTAVVMGIGNTLAPLLSARLLDKFNFNHHLINQIDILLMIFAALVGMLVSASFGVLSLYFSHLIAPELISKVWFIWWLGDSLGVLLALPLMLNLNQKIAKVNASQLYQLMAWVVLFVCAELIIFNVVSTLNKQFILSMFVILPMLIWASMNFGVVGGSLVVISLSSVAVWLTAQGYGTFYSEHISEGIFSLWTFMVTLVITMLLISTLQSERNLAVKSLQKNDKKLRAIIDGALDAILTINDKGLLVEFNPAAERIFGFKKEQVIGKPLHELIIPPRLRSAHVAGHQQYVMSGIGHIFNQRVELLAMRSDGSEFPIELTLAALKEDDLSLVTGFIRDISEQKKARQEIENFAYYDVLTNLPNRRLLVDRFQHAVLIAERTQTYCALFFIDLDNFKLLNDTKGHDIGDQLLIEVSKRIQSVVRAGDTVARLSGDEFVILVENLDVNMNLAYQQASEIAEKLLIELSNGYFLDMFEFNTSASIGLVLFNDSQFGFEEHLRHADTAMYLAKGAGRNTYRFYDLQTQEAIEKSFVLESALSMALKNKEFSLHYQSIVNREKQIVGAEVLLRWRNAVLGNVGPAEFIPILEKNNQIIKVGQWVLRQACEQIQAWKSDELLSKIRLSVNISAKQFLYINFIQELRDILHATGINPGLLKLELTETAVIDNMEDVIHKMRVLNEMGVRISLDDFGIGHSSLVYLKKLPVTQIKIDQSFVHDVLLDSNDAAIIQMILAVGHTIQCDIVAEGVEMQAQFDLLRSFGCEYYQGYYFSRPTEVTHFEQLLRSF
jgi:diguanylate cyclase (GGDEF)-like protein/PAS domain S-box-containing protein